MLPQPPPQEKGKKKKKEKKMKWISPSPVDRLQNYLKFSSK